MNTNQHIRKIYKKWTFEEERWLTENYSILGRKLCAKHLGVLEHDITNRCRKLKLSKIDSRTWTQEETDLLRKYYPIGGGVECKKYINKSYASINDKARRLKIVNPAFWTEEQINILKLNYYEHGAKYCSKLIGRDTVSVIHKAGTLGIKNKKSCLKLPNGKRLCPVCNKIKSLKHFSKERKIKTRSICRTCDAAKARKYYDQHKDDCRIKHKKWYNKNLDKVKAYQKLHRPRYRKLIRERYKTDERFRKSKIKSTQEYRRNPKNKKALQKTRRNARKKFLSNPYNRIISSMRRRMAFVLEGKRKAAHSMELIGCTREQFMAHLESKFTNGMSWENYGRYYYGGKMTWHVDHVIPLDSFDFDKPEEQKKAFHYTNTQPLWATTEIARAKGDKTGVGNLNKGWQYNPVVDDEVL